MNHNRRPSSCSVSIRMIKEARPVDFYFDFSSPYSYIASEWIEALAARHGRTVRWHAVLLGVTFQAAELKSPVSHPIKREYSLHDFERSARFAGVAVHVAGEISRRHAERSARLLVARGGATRSARRTGRATACAPTSRAAASTSRTSST